MRYRARGSCPDSVELLLRIDQDDTKLRVEVAYREIKLQRRLSESRSGTASFDSEKGRVWALG